MRCWEMRKQARSRTHSPLSLKGGSEGGDDTHTNPLCRVRDLLGYCADGDPGGRSPSPLPFSPTGFVWLVVGGWW